MEAVLWYLLAGTQGGLNRIRILKLLGENPRNPNQLAQELDLDYTTVRYHLDLLSDHDLIEDSGEGYGAVYLLTDQLEHDWTTVETIIDTVDIELP